MDLNDDLFFAMESVILADRYAEFRDLYVVEEERRNMLLDIAKQIVNIRSVNVQRIAANQFISDLISSWHEE